MTPTTPAPTLAPTTPVPSLPPSPMHDFSSNPVAYYHAVLELTRLGFLILLTTYNTHHAITTLTTIPQPIPSKFTRLDPSFSGPRRLGHWRGVRCVRRASSTRCMVRQSVSRAARVKSPLQKARHRVTYVPGISFESRSETLTHACAQTQTCAQICTHSRKGASTHTSLHACIRTHQRQRPL